MSDTNFYAKPKYIILNIDGKDNIPHSYKYTYTNDTWSTSPYMKIDTGGSINYIAPGTTGYSAPKISYTIVDGTITSSIKTELYCRRDEDFPTFDIEFDAFLIGKVGNNYNTCAPEQGTICGFPTIISGVGNEDYLISCYDYYNGGFYDMTLNNVFFGEYKGGESYGTGYKLSYDSTNNSYKTESVNYYRPYKLVSSPRIQFKTQSRDIELCYNSYINWKDYFNSLTSYIQENGNEYYTNLYGIEYNSNTNKINVAAGKNPINSKINDFKKSIGYNEVNSPTQLPVCIIYNAVCTSSDGPSDNNKIYSYFTNICVDAIDTSMELYKFNNENDILSDNFGYNPTNIAIDGWVFDSNIENIYDRLTLSIFDRQNFDRIIDQFTGSFDKCANGEKDKVNLDYLNIDDNTIEPVSCSNADCTTTESGSVERTLNFYFKSLLNNINYYSSNHGTINNYGNNRYSYGGEDAQLFTITNEKPIHENSWCKISDYHGLSGTDKTTHEFNIKFCMIQQQKKYNTSENIIETLYTTKVYEKNVTVYTYKFNSNFNITDSWIDWPIVHKSGNNYNYIYSSGLFNSYIGENSNKYVAGEVYSIYKSCESVPVLVNVETGEDCENASSETCVEVIKQGVIYINYDKGTYASCNCTTNNYCLDGYGGLHYVPVDAEYESSLTVGWTGLTWINLTEAKKQDITSAGCRAYDRNDE